MCVSYQPKADEKLALSAVHAAVLAPVKNRMWIVYMDHPNGYRYYRVLDESAKSDKDRWMVASGSGVSAGLTALIETFPTRRNAEMEAMRIAVMRPDWAGTVGVEEIKEKGT